MKKSVIAGAMSVALLGSGVVQAEAGFGLGVKMGTLGMGAEFTKSITESFNARVGFNTYDFSDSGTEGDINYDIDLEWQSTALLLDWYPGSGSFRLTAGYIINGNELKMRAKPTGTYNIGGTSYASDIVSLTGNVTFSNGPYIGLGWGNAARAGFGFSFELGAVYQGSPELDLSGTCTAGSPTCDDFNADVAREEQQAQADLDEFKWYPQVAVGISYGF